MTDKYDVVIVGGGVAGLTSAAYLSRDGYRTLLVEQSHETGGLVHTFWHRGYAFDAGIRAFENSGILFPMLRDLGLTVECLPNPVSIGIMNEWTKLHTRASLEDYQDMLTRVFPANTSDHTATDRLNRSDDGLHGCPVWYRQPTVHGEAAQHEIPDRNPASMAS